MSSHAAAGRPSQPSHSPRTAARRASAFQMGAHLTVCARAFRGLSMRHPIRFTLPFAHVAAERCTHAERSARACVHARVRACVRACMRACVHAYFTCMPDVCSRHVTCTCTCAHMCPLACFVAYAIRRHAPSQPVNPLPCTQVDGSGQGRMPAQACMPRDRTQRQAIG